MMLLSWYPWTIWRTRPGRSVISGMALLAALLSGCASRTTQQEARASSESAQPSSVELFRLGKTAFERGDSIRAEQYFALARKEGYEPRLVIPVLIQVCLQGSRLRAALNHAEPFLLEHPEEEELRYLVATIHLSLGQSDAARMELQQLLQRSSVLADAFYLMGIIDLTDDPSSARHHFQEYLRLSPGGSHAAEVRSRLDQIAARGMALPRGGEKEKAGRGPAKEHHLALGHLTMDAEPQTMEMMKGGQRQ
jgi:tetratricopeptide (TPR) repeat protein